MADLSLERVTDAEVLARWHLVNAAVLAHDHVGLPADPFEEVLPLLGGVDVDSRVEMWLGSLGGLPVAAGGLRLPDADNTATAMVDIRVHPEHRRSGHGVAVLRLLRERAAAEGRSRMFSEAAVPLERGADSPGAAFARVAGARPVLTEVRRMLDLHGVDSDRLAALRGGAAGYADGYSLLQWVDRASEDLLPDLATCRS